MDALKAKKLLKTFTGKNDIRDLFIKKEGLSKNEMEKLWDGYLEFMIIKSLGGDIGLNKQMKYSTTLKMDELWHCHILCTENYKALMELMTDKVNPLVDFIHHSLELSFSSEEEKKKRLQNTAEAYRY